MHVPINSDTKTPARAFFFDGKQLLYALAAVCFLASWLQADHLFPWVSWRSELAAFAYLGLLVVACWRRGDGAVIVPMDPVSLTTLVLGSVVVFQVGVGRIQYLGDAAVLLLYLGALWFAICLATTWENRRTPVEALAWGLLTVGVASAVIGAAQATGVAETVSWISQPPTWRRPGANLAQPNQLGTLLLWAIASVAYLESRGRITWRVATLVGFVGALGVAMTESRTALVGAVLLGAWLAAHYLRGNRTRRVVIMACALAALLCLFFLWPQWIAGVQEGAWGFRTEMVSPAVERGAGKRWVVWPQLLDALWQRPWTGWGLREVSAAHNAVVHRYVESDPFTYAHNVLLDLALGVGIPLTILLSVWVLHCLWIWANDIRGSDDWYAMALVLVFAWHSLLEFPFAYAYFLIPIGFALGSLARNRSSVWTLSIPSVVGVVAVAAWIVCGAVTVWDYVAAEEDFRIARFEALRVGTTPPEYQRPAMVLLTQLGAMNAAIRAIPSPGMERDAVLRLRAAALRFPWPATQKRYALALVLNGDPAEARRMLLVIRAQHGEKMYADIRDQWERLGQEQYPQLLGFVSP